MEDRNKNILEISNSLSKDFSKAGIQDIIAETDAHTLEELKKYLSQKISELLDRNFNQLINALYRIDISEKKVSDVFSEKNSGNISDNLAELIIERQLQKINFRNKYRRGEI